MGASKHSHYYNTDPRCANDHREENSAEIDVSLRFSRCRTSKLMEPASLLMRLGLPV